MGKIPYRDEWNGPGTSNSTDRVWVVSSDPEAWANAPDDAHAEDAKVPAPEEAACCDPAFGCDACTPVPYDDLDWLHEGGEG